MRELRELPPQQFQQLGSNLPLVLSNDKLQLGACTYRIRSVSRPQKAITLD